MRGSAERGMSAPPEVVFDTATDPARPWLPEPLRSAAHAAQTAGELTAEWGEQGSGPWAALRVRPEATGGAVALLEVSTDDDASGLADRCLDMLEQQVSDHMSAS